MKHSRSHNVSTDRGRSSPSGRPYPLTRRSLLHYLWERYGEHRAMAIYVTFSAFISIVLITFVTYLTDAPFVFPALGPTILMVFSHPMSPGSSPRNIILGHLVGWVCGWGSLAVFGLLSSDSILTTGADLPRILAVGLSLALTSGLLVLLELEHPPAAATTLVISLGFMSSLTELAVLMLAVLLVSAQAIVMNRRAGFPYPLWRSPPEGE